jgi:lipoyl(octanoyl) transferase
MYANPNRSVSYKDLGYISYARAWEIQRKHQEYLISQKIARREHNSPPRPNNFLLICEHNPVYTLGKNGKMQNLLIPEAELSGKGIEFYHIERGGDITYHGPGQITGYPIIDLENFFTDLHLYLRNIEKAIIQTIGFYGIIGDVIPGLTGVWVDSLGTNPRKIAAIGIKCSRWVTMHGFALNVNTDLDYFKYIIPCAIDDKAVTSIEQEVGYPVNFSHTKKILKDALAQVFAWKYI